LHVNYGLRGGESDADEQLCRRLCADLGVELEVVRRDRAQDGAVGNLQAWAREARYQAARSLADARGAVVAAAHTRTDQLETILYRLATSPGRRALLGMETDRIWLVRPLLGASVSREETAEWCAANGLRWREDASNSDLSFARARVRERLLPALLEVDDRAPEAILRTSELLRDESVVLDHLVASVLEDGDSIARDRLAALDPALARLVLRRLAEDATGALCPRAANRLGDVLALSEGALDLGDGARAQVRGGVVTVIATPRR
jgi:tRNA(Ile)-lysidine synthase